MGHVCQRLNDMLLKLKALLNNHKFTRPLF